jgi:hypothetical protein
MKHTLSIFLFLAGGLAMGTGAEQTPPVPPPSLPASPVSIFRMLLTTNEAGRTQWLAAKMPEQRRFLEGKIVEYSNLSAEEREKRLQSLQLRWYLPRLMKLPPDERDARLAFISEPVRSLLKSKLEIWDKMPAELQKDLLDNEQAIAIFMYAGVGSASDGVFQALSAERQEELRRQFEDLNKLPDNRRAKILLNFKRFFEMPLTEQNKTLQKLQPTDAAKVKQTLATFEILPPPLRGQALDGFQKFSGLSPEDRAAFLKSAERWQSMSNAEKAKLRLMVLKLQSVQAIPPPMPPMPPPTRPNLAGKSH